MLHNYAYYVRLFCEVIDIFAINKEFGGKRNNTANPYKTFYNILTHGDSILNDINEYNNNKYKNFYEFFSNIAFVDMASYNERYFNCESFKHIIKGYADYAHGDFDCFEVGYFLSCIRNTNKEIYEYYKNEYKRTQYSKFLKITEYLNNKYINERKEIELKIGGWKHFTIFYMTFTNSDNVDEDIKYIRKYIAKNILPPNLSEDYVGIKGIYNDNYNGLIRNVSENKYGCLLS